MDSAMENLSDVTSFETAVNIPQDHIPNNEEDEKTLNEDDTLGEEHSKIIFNKSNAGCKEYKKSLDEVNILSNEIYKDAMTENGIPFNKEDVDKSFMFGNEQDSRVFEDNIHILNNKEGIEVFDNEDNVSDEEQGRSVIKEEIFPTLTKDDIYPTSEDELSFHKGILEEEICTEEPPLHCEPEVVASSISDPPSPVEDELDEELDVQECKSSKKDLTLPYFQLPKPDLDDFLVETEKNLQIHIQSHENKTSDYGSLTSESKLKNRVVSLKPPQNAQGKFFDPKKAFITLDLSPDCSQEGYSRKDSNVSKSNHQVSSGSSNNEYEKVISSLNTDETKSSVIGIKRLTLKEFLKKQIDQKRYEAFNQSKLLKMEDEEMEGVHAEKGEESPETEDEISSDEDEEATVSFENNNQKLVDNPESGDENALTNKSEEFRLDDESSNSDSDDDFIGVRKTKKKFLVLDEDSCDKNFLNEEEKNSDRFEMESTSSCQLQKTECIENEFDEKSDDKLNVCNAETLNRDKELYKNRQNAFGEGVFQTIEKNNALSQISSSMPSYQPGGGFLNQERRQEDSLDSITDIHNNINGEDEDLYEHYQPEEKFLRSSRTPVLENETVLENASFTHSDDSNTFGIKLGDLPVTQTENDSDIFLTKDLADVCSGAFNDTDAISQRKLDLGYLSEEKNKIFYQTPRNINKHEEKDDKDAISERKLDLRYLSEEKVTDFFDDEAELSGEDDGVDDKDNDSEGGGDNLDLYPSDEEDLPAAEVLREEIADLHMKRIMDDDAERIREIQEQFLDDGELNSDGAGRSRRFAWINNDVELAPAGDKSDSDSDVDFVDDTVSSMNQEKAKWRQENKEDEKEDLTEELNSSGYRRRSFLKVNIIGKPKFSHEENSSRLLSCKRPRGSFLNLDDSSASQVLKKLKASEDNFGGSRTTKHFVFRNDLTEASAFGKGPVKSSSISPLNTNGSPKIRSIFNKI